MAWRDDRDGMLPTPCPPGVGVPSHAKLGRAQAVFSRAMLAQPGPRGAVLQVPASSRDAFMIHPGLTLRVNLILEGLLRSLEEEHGLATHNARRITLDPSSVGSLSHMDALQQQAMAQASRQRLDVQRRRVEAALERVRRGGYSPRTRRANPAAPTSSAATRSRSRTSTCVARSASSYASTSSPQASTATAANPGASASICHGTSSTSDPADRWSS